MKYAIYVNHQEMTKCGYLAGWAGREPQLTNDVSQMVQCQSESQADTIMDILRCAKGVKVTSSVPPFGFSIHKCAVPA